MTREPMSRSSRAQLLLRLSQRNRRLRGLTRQSSMPTRLPDLLQLTLRTARLAPSRIIRPSNERREPGRGGGLQCVGVVSFGRPMAADQYRQRAFEAQQCAAQATDSSVKHGWQLLVQRWLALAEQVDRFERRYGSPVATDPVPYRSEAVVAAAVPTTSPT